MEQNVKSALRRMAEAGRPAPDGVPMTPARAIGQALSKVARDRMNLDLQVLETTQVHRSLADLPEMLEALALLAIIEGPEEGLGLVALPQATLSAVLAMQTMGRLGATPPAPRKPTRIDAAMAAEFIDAVLVAIEETLAPTEDVIWAGGFRYASHLDDPRPLDLLLDDIGYRVWSCDLQFGAEGHKGGFLWAVPQNGRGHALRRRLRESAPASSGAAATDAAADFGAEALWAGQMEATVLGAAAPLDAVLHRVTLPLAAVLGFCSGMELPLPEDALERIAVEGLGRRKVSLARLGQSRGNRALRLIEEEALEVGPQNRAGRQIHAAAELPEGESPYDPVADMDRGGMADFDPGPEALPTLSNLVAEAEPMEPGGIVSQDGTASLDGSSLSSQP